MRDLLRQTWLLVLSMVAGIGMLTAVRILILTKSLLGRRWALNTAERLFCAYERATTRWNEEG